MSCSNSLRRSPKPGAFTASHVDRAAQFINNQSGERLAFNVFGDDQDRLAQFRNLLKDGQQVAHRRNLLLAQQNKGFVSTASIFSGSVMK